MRKIFYICLALMFSTSLYSQSYVEIHASALKLKPSGSGSEVLTVTIPNLSAGSLTFTLPSTNGTNGQILQTDGNGALSWATVSGGGVAGDNTEIQFNSGGVFAAADSLVWNNTDKHLGINNNSPTAALSVGKPIQVGRGSGESGLRIYASNDFYFDLKPPSSLSSNITYTLPNAYGSNGQLLTTNGSLNLQWSSTAVSSGSDCVGIGEEGNDTGNNTVSGALGFVGGGTGNNIGTSGGNSFIGAGQDNLANANSSAIGGGEDNSIFGSGFSLIGSGRFNSVQSGYSAIMTGEYDTIFSGADYSFIGAGRYNKVKSSYSSIGAGENNTIDTSSNYSFIGAGRQNTIRNSPSSAIASGVNNDITGGSHSMIGAGEDNEIAGSYSFIGAGDNNSIATGADYSAIGGGENNRITGDYSSIPMGRNDTITGNYSLILGHDSDISSNNSVAIGRNANVSHNGSFVVKAGNTTTASSSTTNQFTAMFNGGILFYSNSGLNNGAELESGSNSWATISDRNRKQDIYLADLQSIAERLSELDIYSWNYKDTPDENIRNYGPMAQDFYRLFGQDDFGQYATDTTIIPLHLTSVAIANIQNNDRIIQEKKIELEEIKTTNDLLESELIELEKRILELKRRRQK